MVQLVGKDGRKRPLQVVEDARIVADAAHIPAVPDVVVVWHTCPTHNVPVIVCDCWKEKGR